MSILIKGNVPLPTNCMVCFASKPNQFNELLCHGADDMNVTNCCFERHPNCPMEEVEDGEVYTVRGYQ